MRELYKNLLEALQNGESAAVVSSCGKNGITRMLLRETDPDDRKAQIMRLYVGGAAERTEGPLSFAQTEDGVSLVEYYAPRPRLLIFGGGHIALSLSAMGAMLDFQVVVFDDRPVFANDERFPSAHAVICDSFANVMDRLQIRKNDYVVIVTRGHQHDTLCLQGVLRGTLPDYMGMIGSKRRVGIVRKQLAEEGFPPEDIARLYSPIGLRIGAATPQEISVSIMAEIVSHKRQGQAGAENGAPAWKQNRAVSDLELAEWLADDGNEAEALVTVVATKGSAPREAGAKMAVGYDGIAKGTIGGGCAEAGIMQDARAVIRNGGYCVKTIDLTDDEATEEGMVCGGTMTVFIEKLA
ncbi:MAG: XdhC family protein [Clostridiales Family XIII bacterium]|jgi:xanthine dehydrogenase accessory factor|nr:XdhC family protein [Clostridiales Family XIII bacterium]